MTRVSWSDSNLRTFETGLDRGVLYPRGGTAVAWNGLTSVDENGAEDSQAYYIEGRPYLFVPSPKEFQATIKAYTYPDEFFPMMGLVEATDGMYLDSQPSDVFDLSYRTLIGNSVAGTDYGYKIHLIYNATVDPQGNSYASLTDAVNPNELSWNIKAVPVAVTGYRATAHVILDTRHIDSVTLAELEALLYGSEDTDVTSLPLPGDLFDAINFTGEVVVTDIGDGEWLATGAYHDIVIDGNGNFTITNVDAIMLPDGTYYFGEAPTPPDPVPTESLDGGSPTDPGAGLVDAGTSATSGGDVYDGGTP